MVLRRSCGRSSESTVVRDWLALFGASGWMVFVWAVRGHDCDSDERGKPNFTIHIYIYECMKLVSGLRLVYVDLIQVTG